MSDISAAATLDVNRAGNTLLRRRWKAASPVAAMLGVHGINEHSGRYEEVGKHLADSGIDTEFFDQRGHGQSGGRRSYIETFDHFCDDIEDLLEQRRELGVPVVLFGHSMGGLIVGSYLAAGRPKPDAVVLSAPAFDSSNTKNERRLATFMGKVAPKVFVKRATDPSELSSDSAIQDQWNNDPLVIRGTTGALAMNSFTAMPAASMNVQTCALPTYVLHGDADPVIPISVSESMKHLPHVTYRRWPGMRHECLNEVGRNDVMAEVSNWITSQVESS